MASLNDENFPLLPSQQLCQTARRPKLLSTQPIATNDKMHNTNTLPGLPNELLFMIFDFLSGPEESSHVYDSEPAYRHWLGTRLRFLDTVKSLSTTCHRLHDAMAARLYSDYDSATGPPYLFLRTLITSPRSAALVRSISFSPYYECRRRSKPSKPTLSDCKIIKSGLKNLNIPEWKRWATACNNGIDREYVLATILMYTTHIKTIIYAREDREMPPLWLQHIKVVTSGNSFGHMHDFAHLERVHVNTQNVSFTELVPLFRLPSLRHLTLEGLEDSQVLEGTHRRLLKWSLAPGTSLLEELCLPACLIHSRNLASLLNACRHLKTFSYTPPVGSCIVLPLSPAPGSPLVHHPTVYTALRGSRATLETIQYMPAYCDDYEFPLDFNNGHRDGPLGSFVDFPRLSSVMGTLGAFADVGSGHDATLANKLPCALTNLHIFVGCAAERQGILALQHLAETFATHLPNLTVLNVNCLANKSYESKFLDSDRVLELFRESDIKYRLVTHLLGIDEMETPGENESDDPDDSSSLSEESEDEDLYGSGEDEGKPIINGGN